MPTRTPNVISYTCGDRVPFSSPSPFFPSKKEERILSLASEQALKSRELKKHGAVFVINGKVVSQGFNKPAAKKRDFSRLTTIHAENSAIIQFIRRMPRLASYSRISGTLYIVRVGNDDCYKKSKPCCLCTPFLEGVPFVKEVVYSDEDNTFFKMSKLNS